jgi:hypothetical protein
MDETQLRTETAPQSGSGYDSSDDYDKLLLLLVVGKNSSSSFTSKTKSTVKKRGAEPGSSQPMFDGLDVCERCCQNQNREGQGDDGSTSSIQSAFPPAFPNLTARSEDPQVAMFQDFFQIPTALPSAMQYGVHPVI